MSLLARIIRNFQFRPLTLIGYASATLGTTNLPPLNPVGNQGTVVCKPGASRAAGNTAVLLGAKIASLASFENGTSELHFSNRARPAISGSSAEYESYHISGPGEPIVV